MLLGETLRIVSLRQHVHLDDIRSANPELRFVGDDDELPLATPVRIPLDARRTWREHNRGGTAAMAVASRAAPTDGDSSVQGDAASNNALASHDADGYRNADMGRFKADFDGASTASDLAAQMSLFQVERVKRASFWPVVSVRGAHAADDLSEPSAQALPTLRPSSGAHSLGGPRRDLGNFVEGDIKRPRQSADFRPPSQWSPATRSTSSQLIARESCPTAPTPPPLRRGQPQSRPPHSKSQATSRGASVATTLSGAPDTIRGVSELMDVDAAVLRRLNPHLAAYDDDDPLPSDAAVALPAPTAKSNEPSRVLDVPRDGRSQVTLTSAAFGDDAAQEAREHLVAIDTAAWQTITIQGGARARPTVNDAPARVSRATFAAHLPTAPALIVETIVETFVSETDTAQADGMSVVASSRAATSAGGAINAAAARTALMIPSSIGRFSYAAVSPSEAVIEDVDTHHLMDGAQDADITARVGTSSEDRPFSGRARTYSVESDRALGFRDKTSAVDTRDARSADGPTNEGLSGDGPSTVTALSAAAASVNDEPSHSLPKVTARKNVSAESAVATTGRASQLEAGLNSDSLRVHDSLREGYSLRSNESSGRRAHSRGSSLVQDDVPKLQALPVPISRHETFQPSVSGHVDPTRDREVVMPDASVGDFAAAGASLHVATLAPATSEVGTPERARPPAAQLASDPSMSASGSPMSLTSARRELSKSHERPSYEGGNPESPWPPTAVAHPETAGAPVGLPCNADGVHTDEEAALTRAVPPPSVPSKQHASRELDLQLGGAVSLPAESGSLTALSRPPGAVATRPDSPKSPKSIRGERGDLFESTAALSALSISMDDAALNSRGAGRRWLSDPNNQVTAVVAGTSRSPADLGASTTTGAPTAGIPGRLELHLYHQSSLESRLREGHHEDDDEIAPQPRPSSPTPIALNPQDRFSHRALGHVVLRTSSCSAASVASVSDLGSNTVSLTQRLAALRRGGAATSPTRRYFTSSGAGGGTTAKQDTRSLLRQWQSEFGAAAQRSGARAFTSPAGSRVSSVPRQTSISAQSTRGVSPGRHVGAVPPHISPFAAARDRLVQHAKRDVSVGSDTRSSTNVSALQRRPSGAAVVLCVTSPAVARFASARSPAATPVRMVPIATPPQRATTPPAAASALSQASSAGSVFSSRPAAAALVPRRFMSPVASVAATPVPAGSRTASGIASPIGPYRDARFVPYTQRRDLAAANTTTVSSPVPVASMTPLKTALPAPVHGTGFVSVRKAAPVVAPLAASRAPLQAPRFALVVDDGGRVIDASPELFSRGVQPGDKLVKANGCPLIR